MKSHIHLPARMILVPELGVGGVYVAGGKVKWGDSCAGRLTGCGCGGGARPGRWLGNNVSGPVVEAWSGQAWKALPTRTSVCSRGLERHHLDHQAVTGRRTSSLQVVTDLEGYYTN